MSYTINGQYIKKNKTIEHFFGSGLKNLEYITIIETNDISKVNFTVNENNKTEIKFINVKLNNLINTNMTSDHRQSLIVEVDSIKKNYQFSFNESEDSFTFVLESSPIDITELNFQNSIKILQKTYCTKYSQYHFCSHPFSTKPLISSVSNKYLYPVIGGSDIDLQILNKALINLENILSRKSAIDLIKKTKQITYITSISSGNGHPNNTTDINIDISNIISYPRANTSINQVANSNYTTTQPGPDDITDITIDKMVYNYNNNFVNVDEIDYLYNIVDGYVNANINKKEEVIIILKYLMHNLKQNNYEPTSVIDYSINVNIGPPGIQGDQGPKGDRGQQGDPGPIGIQGNRGPVGPQGSRLCVGGNNTICLEKDHIQFFIDLYNLANNRN